MGMVIMAHKRIKSSRYPGVYWRESSRNRFNGRPDRCFDFCVKIDGKLKWINVGWLSEGISEKQAAQARKDYLTHTKQSLIGQDTTCQTALSPETAQISELSATPTKKRECSNIKEHLAAVPQVTTIQTYTLNDAVELYLSYLATDTSSGDSRDRNGYDVTFRNTLGKMPLSEIKAGQIQQIKTELLKRLAPATVLRRLSTCRAAVFYAIKQEMWTGVNPFGRDRLTMPRPQNKGERFLTPEEAKTLLVELQKRSPALHDMAWLSLKTGLRSTEIFRLQGADIDINAGVLWITEKGGNRTALHVSRQVIDKLAAYGRQPSEYIFPDRHGGKMTHISDTFERVCVELGWNPATPQEKGKRDFRKRVWFHTLRHTFASWLAQSGKVTLYELRDLMRHKSITMTERYAHLIPAQTFKKAAIIDEIL